MAKRRTPIAASATTPTTPASTEDASLDAVAPARSRHDRRLPGRRALRRRWRRGAGDRRPSSPDRHQDDDGAERRRHPRARVPRGTWSAAAITATDFDDWLEAETRAEVTKSKKSNVADYGQSTLEGIDLVRAGQHPDRAAHGGAQSPAEVPDAAREGQVAGASSSGSASATATRSRGKISSRATSTRRATSSS